jgi:hypothetical protein
MKSYYILTLYPNGDIEIVKRNTKKISFDEVVLHKTYNPSETIKDNLINMYEEWEKLIKENEEL